MRTRMTRIIRMVADKSKFHCREQNENTDDTDYTDGRG